MASIQESTATSAEVSSIDRVRAELSANVDRIDRIGKLAEQIGALAAELTPLYPGSTSFNDIHGAVMSLRLAISGHSALRDMVDNQAALQYFAEMSLTQE